VSAQKRAAAKVATERLAAGGAKDAAAAASRAGAGGLEAQLLETWAIHDRINRYLLDAIAPEALADQSASKGRTVGEQFAHMHNVRLMWLKAADPARLRGLRKIEKEDPVDHARLREALAQSAAAIDALLRAALAGDGRIKGFRPHASAFLGYLISHESHHRGQIALALKQSGHPLDKKVAYGIWEWGVR
jgi:uncharacterized damage-inducible protein DinB